MAERLKLVVDTNVVVSAALQPLRNPARALFLAVDRHHVFVSREIFEEYRDVLFREKLKLDPRESNRILDFMRDHCELVRPLFHIHACKDPDDDKFLDCAAAAGADYIITGNKRDFPTTPSKPLIVSPREFLALPG